MKYSFAEKAAEIVKYRQDHNGELPPEIVLSRGMYAELLAMQQQIETGTKGIVDISAIMEGKTNSMLWGIPVTVRD